MQASARLVEKGGCIFDSEQLFGSHGFESLDAVGQEAFVNHVHFHGPDREHRAKELIERWTIELRTYWPAFRFRIYWCEDDDEITVRFHRVRDGVPNWYDSGLSNVSIIEVAA